MRTKNHRSNDASSSLPLDLLGGLIAGGLATWVMTRFQVGPGRRIQKRLNDAWSGGPSQSDAGQGESNEYPATVKVASAVYGRVTGGKSIPSEWKASIGQWVHYSFGSLQGVSY